MPVSQHLLPDREIAPGLAADLTVLKGDPSRDIRSLAAVHYTLRDGRIIYRAADRGERRR